MRRRVSLWLFALVLAVSLDAMTLGEAEKALTSPDKSVVFQAYDTFKSHYLRALTTHDTALKRRTLQGIVQSGRTLRIDVRKYEASLKSLPAVPAPVSPPPVVPTKPTKARKNTASTSVKAPSEPPVIKPLPTLSKLRDVRWNEGRLELQFSRDLNDRSVNFFKLKPHNGRGNRYVFDVHAALDHARTINHEAIKKIRIAQYKPSTLRLVLESNTPLKLRFKRNGKTLIINPGLSKTTSPKLNPPMLQRKPRVVVIDPGHGGKDAGAVGYRKAPEKQVVLSIGNELARILKSRGYTVFATRTKDRFIKLRNRTGMANKKQADLFISIHANAVPKHKVKKIQGVETYFLSPSRSDRAERVAAKENSAEIEEMGFYGKNTFLSALNSEKIIASHKLAIDLQSSMLLELGQHYKGITDGGVREGPFWVLVGAQMPAVLVEVGFITHPVEGKRLATPAYRKRLAKGLADGVDRYFAKNP